MCKYSSKKHICLHIWTICMWPSNPWLRIIFAPRSKCCANVAFTVPSLRRIANLVQYQPLLLRKFEQNWANVVFECTKWNSAAIKSLLLFMASLFIGFLVEKYVACQSRKSDFGWHRFRFSPCLMRKRVEKSEAILASLDSFQCISNGKPEWFSRYVIAAMLVDGKQKIFVCPPTFVHITIVISVSRDCVKTTYF